MTAPQVTVRLADLHAPSDAAAVLDLLDMYAQDLMGGGHPLAAAVRQRLIPDLRSLPNARVFLATQAAEPIGLAICFLGYSSFQGRPLINIHDLAIVPHWRGHGIGRALLQAVEEEGRRSNCCRITLEVRADNARARRLYEDFGFVPGDPETDALAFWKKPL